MVCLLALWHSLVTHPILSLTSPHTGVLTLTHMMQYRIVLGKISTSDGPTNAYTIIRGRWVGKSS